MLGIERITNLINIHGTLVDNSLPFVLIAGPCQIEGRDHAHYTAAAIKEICKELGVKLIYKSSFDKANRSSINSQRGVGIEEGLRILKEIKDEYNLPVITDVHECWQIEHVKEVVDVIQIPAFLCRQTDLLIAAGKTGLPINIKKGQFLDPAGMENVAAKIYHTGNPNVMLCERGTTFGYNNLVVDFRGIEVMKRTGYPVIFDATHSVQHPGANGQSSGGDREMVWPLAKAACAIGVAGIFMEMHEDPDRAPSDGANMIKIHDAKEILRNLRQLDTLAKNI